MEDDFQNDKNEKDIKQANEEYEKDIEEREEEEEEIEDIENNDENNKTNKIDESQFNNPNTINNKRNYNNSTKRNNLNQGQRVNKNPNSINLNRIQNIKMIPSQTQRINESQNIFNNRNPNLNFNNNPLFNNNQNYYQNQMFIPNNNNFAQLNDFNNLNQNQNIYPNYYPQFNNFNQYTPNINNNYSQFNNFNPYVTINYLSQENMELKKKLIELENKIYQNQSLDNNQEEFINFNNNNEEQENKKKYKKEIDSIYNRNLWKVNKTLKNKIKVFDSKDNLENKEEIIIYITKNKANDFIEKLNEIKAVIFEDLKIPKITYEMIEQKIKNTKYEKTEEDNILLKDYEKNYKLKDKIYYNKYMFYSQNKISLFTPHIIKARKNIMSLFFPEKLNSSDFQYKDYHKNINNDIFLNLLKLRINQFNDYEKKDGKITDKRYNEKIFGFNKSYLYSTMDEDILSEKLNVFNINSLFENLTAPKSQIYTSGKENARNYYEIFNRNTNFLKGLTYEELILYIILNKIENKYEIFPRILFYEYYLTINGEKVVVSDKIEPGYSEADFAFYSKCDYKYEEEPLIIQKKYQYDNIYNNLSYSNESFEIKSNTLYFIECKSSFNLSGEDEVKRHLIYEEFFTKLFNKYKVFIHLYESKNWIKEDTKREILLIYDNDIIEISEDIEDIINNLLKENPNCTFKIIYTLKSYPYFSHSIAIRKHNQLTQKYNKLSKKNEELSKKNEELSKKIEEILKDNKKREEENKKIKEQLDNLYKKNGFEINNKVENNEKKNEVSQNAESQNQEIKNNLTNNNRIENIEVSKWGKNNNETKKDEN